MERGDSTAELPFVSVLILTIKLCVVTIGSQIDSREPRGSLPHNIADFLIFYVVWAFNHDFIMHVCDNVPIREVSDSVAEKIPGDGLDDVFNKLRAIAFNAATRRRRWLPGIRKN